MTSYSQFGEDDIIIRYFNHFKGVLLDIGANDGVTLSNSRALIEKGWGADLVEPAAIPYKKLAKLYKDNSLIKLHNYAIDNESGLCNFYESTSLFNIKDSGLLSTIKENYLVNVYQTNFTQYEIETLSFKDFQEKSLYKKWDFINIDTEGCDWDILQQINLIEVDCKCLCIEYNGHNPGIYIDYCKNYNLSLLYQNDINLILCKKNQ